MRKLKLKCKQCNSEKLIKAGRVWCGKRKRQQYLCKSCGKHTCYPIKEKAKAEKAKAKADKAAAAKNTETASKPAAKK